MESPPRDNIAKTGTAVLRGRIVAADSGQPLRKAQVRIFSPELRETPITVAGDDLADVQLVGTQPVTVRGRVVIGPAATIAFRPSAVALDYVEPGESTDPDFLERVRMSATPFSIGEGEAKALSLKLSTPS